jgi:SP family general alpha glucoside:H+ symporter-like MFS transporter
LDEAERTVERLGGKMDTPAHETVAFMVRTDEFEKQTTAGATYLDCFKGTELRRTAIVCLIFAYQNFSGNQIGNQATYYFERES